MIIVCIMSRLCDTNIYNVRRSNTKWTLGGSKVVVVNVPPALILADDPVSNMPDNQAMHTFIVVFFALVLFCASSICTHRERRTARGGDLTCSNSSMSCCSLTLPRSWPDWTIRTRIPSICRDRSGLTSAMRETGVPIESNQWIAIEDATYAVRVQPCPAL